jgi:hypothetical protein
VIKEVDVPNSILVYYNSDYDWGDDDNWDYYLV